LDSPSGIFFYGEDITKRNSSGPSYSLTNVTKIWEFWVGSLQIDGTAIPINGYAIFDPNFEYIGLPYDIYQNITNILLTKYGLNCTAYNECYGNRDISTLPTFYLGSQKIAITLDVYLELRNGRKVFTYGFSPTSTQNLTNTFYVIPAYKNHVILGFSFMLNYYSVLSTPSQLQKFVCIGLKNVNFYVSDKIVFHLMRRIS